MRNLSHTFSRFFVYNLLLILGLSQCTPAIEFDTLLYNVQLADEGKNEGIFWIGINSDTIAAIGELGANEPLPSAQAQFDLEGEFLYPGFIDAHGHLFGYARTLSTVNLVGAATKEECIERIASYIQEHPDTKWIVGRGWDQNDWPEKSFPTAGDLKLFEDVFIYMVRIDGHAAWVNQNVLNAFNIDQHTRIDGGEIIDGVLIDNAESLVEVPALTSAFWRDALLKAQDNLVKYGLTAMTDAGLSVEQILLLDSLQEEGQFHLLVNAMISNTEEDLEYFETNGPIEKPLLRVKSVKAYLDGALGSRGALLRAPYHDLPDHYGLPLMSSEELDQLRDRCLNNQWQLCVHAIGDSAHHILLRSFQFLPKDEDLRFRVEHAQIMTPEDSMYYTHPNIVASVQPTHATSDMYWAEERLGPHRIGHAYSYKRIFNTTPRVAFGTDFPIEHIDPLATFFAATTRQDRNHWPEEGFLPEQRITPQQAIEAMTAGAAYSAFGESDYGKVEIGQKANFTLLNANLYEKNLERNSVVVSRTMVGGQWLYNRDEE